MATRDDGIDRLDGPYSGNIDNIQEAVASWGWTTFPRATVESTVAHLKAEVEEIEEAVVLGKSPADIGEEIADATLLLMSLAKKLDLSMQEIVTKKFIKAQMRRYGQPNARGFTEHIRDDD